MGFVDLVFDEMRRRDISLRKLADLAGVDVSTLSKIINDGTRPSTATIRKMQPILGKTEDELLAMTGHRSASPAPARPQPLMPVLLPVYDQPVSAGKGEPAVQEYMYLSPDIGVRPNWYGLPVRGDCMVPRLRSGDIVVVNPDGVAEPGDMVVVDIDDEVAMVKWFVKRKGTFFLQPENGDPIPFDEERMRIVGVVMRTQGAKPHKGRE